MLCVVENLRKDKSNCNRYNAYLNTNLTDEELDYLLNTNENIFFHLEYLDIIEEFEKNFNRKNYKRKIVIGKY